MVPVVYWSHLVIRMAIELMLIYQMGLGLRLHVSTTYSFSIQDTGKSGFNVIIHCYCSIKRLLCS